MAGVFGSARENPVTFGITERERKSRYLQHKALYNKSLAKAEQFKSLPANTYLQRLKKNNLIVKQARKSGNIQKTLTALNYGQFGDYK